MTDSARSYRPGSWFGIFGEHATVLLPPTEKARIGQLWELVDGGAGFDEVLDALISSGLRELPGFVLVSEIETDTKVVIRGAARASFTTEAESVELEGSAATTWVERSLTGITGMRIEVEDGAVDDEDLRIASGLVRVGRVDAPPYAGEPEAVPDELVVVLDEAEPASEPEPEPETRAVIIPPWPADVAPAAEEAEPQPEPQSRSRSRSPNRNPSTRRSTTWPTPRPTTRCPASARPRRRRCRCPTSPSRPSRPHPRPRRPTTTG